MRILPVPYFAQNDNEPWDDAHGNVQCCPTANAMLGFYLRPDLLNRSKVNGFVEPESYYKYVMNLAGFSASDRGNHDAHTEVLSRYFGIDSKWRYDLDRSDFIRSIDDGYPAVCGLAFKSSGHIAIVVGYSKTGLVISDPYGIRAGTSNVYEQINPGHGELTGKEDGYSWNALDVVLFPGGGWGRMVNSVAASPPKSKS